MNLKKKKRKESQKLVLGVEMYPYISAIYIIQKTKIMASSPITSQQIDGETVETVSDFFGGGLQKSLQMVKLKDTYSLEGKLWST